MSDSVSAGASSGASAGASAYENKQDDYFLGARDDFIGELPVNPEAKILEIGCSAGGTGALALSEKKCGSYYAVELSETAAMAAREKLTEVIVGDIEKMESLPWPEKSFDALIMSEVLEHFADPWAVLRKLKKYLKPNSLVFCSSPNVAHYRIMLMMWRGDWKLEDAGIMDRTHLRWFTPKTYAELLQDSGYIVEYTKPIKPIDTWDRIRSFICGGRPHLFMKQIKVRARCPE